MADQYTDHYRDLYFAQDYPFSDEQRKQIDSFFAGLNGLGVDIHVHFSDDMPGESAAHSVYMSYNIDELKKIRTRGAGRKQVVCTKTVREVKDYLQNHTVQEAAIWAGISEASFYRYMRGWKKDGSWDDPSYETTGFVI